MRSVPLFLIGVAALAAVALAADWPEWRGVGRQGVWAETGIIERIPSDGLKVKWRAPIRAGYSGPAVADGRVFLLDYERKAGTRVSERVVCLDEKTGRTLWTRTWDADYRGLSYDNGPRATPTVAGDRVYVLGAMGSLRCLRTADGSEVWSVDFVRDFGAVVPAWGMSSAPLVVDSKLIAIAGGKGKAKVVALDKNSGREIWRALSSDDSEPGYSQPVLIHHGGRAQVVVWHATALESLDPGSGAVLWSLPFRVTMNTPIATPAWEPPHLLVSGFFDGARMMELGSAGDARLLWGSAGGNEVKADKLHALMSQPVIIGDYIYGICSFGQLRCLRRSTGEQVWETQAVTVEKTRNATAWMIRNQDRILILNDRGEFILAKFAPSGYKEIGRTKVIRPTSPAGGRRELGAVIWSHPAFAKGHMIIRNDEEVIRVSLDRRDYP